jgi:S-DNA-T family DNA segregation ATPase FtsK/SpoIIIE
LKSSEPEFRIRLITIAGAVVLGLFAIILGIFIIGAFFDFPGFSIGPGSSLVRSYGILSFIIPVYLFCAALTLADSTYHPDRMLVLCTAIFPLITLTVGYAFIRNFDAWVEKFALFALLRRTGFSFVVVLVTVFEIIVILAVRDLLFVQKHEPETQERPRRLREQNRLLEKQDLLKLPRKRPSFIPIRLPSPGSGQRQSRKTDTVGPEKPSPLRTVSDDDPEVEQLLHTLHLPKLTPLKSSAALKQFEKDFGRNTDAAVEQVPKTTEPPPKQSASVPNPSNFSKGPIPLEGMLRPYAEGQYWLIDEATKEATVLLRQTLEECDVPAEITGVHKGPVITMFEIVPAPGIKLSHVVNIQEIIAEKLAASSVRITVPAPDKHIIGIEIPNKKRNLVALRGLLEIEMQHKNNKLLLPLILGRGVSGQPLVVDLAMMPHILVAGAPGTGKSVCLNTLILSILYQRTPAECRLCLIDLQTGKLILYNDVPHLLTPVIVDPRQALMALQYCMGEIKRRYDLLDSLELPDIYSYNHRPDADSTLPYLVVVINEFPDIGISDKKLESLIVMLADAGRDAGIHLILATEQLSDKVLTEATKSSIPGRLVFMTASKADSRLILGITGAETLLGKGDMLYFGGEEPFPVRVQGALVSDEEVKRVTEYLKKTGIPDYVTL